MGQQASSTRVWIQWQLSFCRCCAALSPSPHMGQHLAWVSLGSLTPRRWAWQVVSWSLRGEGKQTSRPGVFTSEWLKKTQSWGPYSSCVEPMCCNSLRWFWCLSWRIHALSDFPLEQLTQVHRDHEGGVAGVNVQGKLCWIVLEKTLESPLDCKEIKPDHFLKEMNPEYSLEVLMLKLKLQYLAIWCK